MKRKIKSGNVFEIPLSPYIDGYSYGKYVDISDFDSNFSYPDLMRIFNFVSKERMQGLDNIPTRELLFNPCFISGFKDIFSLWKLVGYEKVEQEDRFIPYVKRSLNPLYRNVSDVEDWLVYDEKRKYYDDTIYSNKMVQHLDVDGLISVDLISFRIAVELFKIEEKNIADYFQLDIFQRDVYDKTFSIPLLSTIPNSLRGRM
jgi:hypothetical protein